MSRCPALTVCLMSLGALVLAVAVELSPAVAQAANGMAAVPAAVVVLQGVERSLGGRVALSKLQSYEIDGAVEGLSGFSGTYRLMAARGGKRRAEWDIRYISQIRAVDGKTAWERNATVRELVDAELERIQRESESFPVVNVPNASDVAISATEVAGVPAFVVTYLDKHGWRSQLAVDRTTYRPLYEEVVEPFPEGMRPVRRSFSDYRRVNAINVPFAIREEAPDGTLAIQVLRYRLNSSIPEESFKSPSAPRIGEPIELSLATVPSPVYKEILNVWDERRFWGVYYPLHEGWTVNLVVNERNGRFVRPTGLVVEFYSGAKHLKTIAYDQEFLASARRFPVSRFNPQPEIYHYRFDHLEPQDLAIDRVVYTLDGVTRDGAHAHSTLDVPVATYAAKHAFIFPIKGNFIAISGHDADELDHKYERSQQFAYDIVSLGPQLELRNPDGSSYGFGRTQVIAPASGKIIYARNDVPDDQIKRDFLKRDDGKWAIGGNDVLIDHGNGEFSLLAHMKQGSVRVEVGDQIHQGDVIGLIGSSGSPGNPHLHYQLQNNPGLFEGDGLPVAFTNIRPAGWYEDGPFMTLKRGVYLNAK